MKKILAILLMLLMILSSVTLGTLAAGDDYETIIEEDFSMGSFYWSTGGGAGIDGGTLNFQNRFSEYKNNFMSGVAKWNNAVIEFDFTITEESKTPEKGPWFMVNGFGVSFFTRLAGPWYFTSKEVKETKIGEYKIDVGETYRARITGKGRGVSFELKKKGEDAFSMLGVVSKTEESFGGLGFVTYHPAKIDNVKIYKVSKSGVTKNNVFTVPVGNVQEIEFNNKVDNPKFLSSDESVAMVDETGKIIGMKNGFAQIDVQNSSGKVVDVIGVKVYKQISAITPSYVGNDGKIFYVGEVFSIGAKVSPSDAGVTLEWSVEGEALTLDSMSTKNNTFTAVKEGIATIICKDILGAAEMRFEVKVLPADKKPMDKSANVNIGFTGEKSKIVAQLGMHVGPAVMADNSGVWSNIFKNDIVIKTIRNEQALLRKVFGRGEEIEDSIDVIQNLWKPYGIGNVINVPVYTVISGQKTDDEIMRQLEVISEQNKTDYPMHIELDNESYSQAHAVYYKTAEDYAQWAVNITKKIKERWPDTKVYPVLVSAETETRILSDKNNTESLTGDWAYTQGGRIWEWNDTVLKYKDNFDGFNIHSYQSSENVDGLTAEDYIKDTLVYASGQQYYTQLNMYDRIGTGKPFAFTEWGQLCGDVFWAGGYDSAAKTRHQRGKYPISAMGNMEMFLNQIKGGHIEASHYHTPGDSQGFGLWEDNNATDTMKTCNYHVFKEISDLLYVKNNDYFYDIQGINSGYKIDKRPFYWADDENVILENISAWGLGNESELKNVVIANHTNVPQKVSLNGAQIKPVWSYGGEANKIAPEWSKNESYTSYDCKLYELENAEELLPLPDTHTNAFFEDVVEIQPYTIMTVEVAGTPAIIEGHVGTQLSEITEYRLNNALALKIGNNTAVDDLIKTPIDKDNASIVPVVKDGRTLLPLRFVAESFGCDVGFDDATSVITITGDGIYVQMTLCKKEYTVNGESKTLDVPAEATDGRTLVPLRALAEAIGKDVLWDSRGLIIVTNAKTAFLAYDETTGVVDKGYVDESDAHIDEILALF